MRMPVTPIPAQSLQIQPKHSFGELPRTAGTMPVWQPKGDFAAHLNEANPTEMTAKTDNSSFGFGDIIDIINPLQHLPIIGHIYREITGDTLSPVSRVAGGALFGGFLGAGGALATLAFNDIKDTSHTPTHNFAEGPRTAGTLRPHTATTLTTVQSIAQTPLA